MHACFFCMCQQLHLSPSAPNNSPDDLFYLPNTNTHANIEVPHLELLKFFLGRLSMRE